MADIPEKAVAAALGAVMGRLVGTSGRSPEWGEEIVRDALEAAGPAMAEHVAAKIAEHRDEHWPTLLLARRLGPHADYVRTARRHLTTAVQVAAFAFSTGDDIRRMAAEALARGDYMGCPSLGAREDDDRA